MKKLLPLLLAVGLTPCLRAQDGPTPYPSSPDDWPGRGPIRTFKYMTDNRNSFWTRRNEDQRAIVLVGDSLMAGKKWQALEDALPNEHVVSRGIGGDTSRGLLFRFKEDVLDLNPKAVVILIGTNDLSAHGKPADTISNITEMIRQAHEQNPNLPLIVCTIPPRDNPKSPTQPGKLEELNSQILALGSDKVRILDLHALLALPDGKPNPEFFGEDKLHLAPPAYGTFSAEIKKLLQEMKVVE